MTSSPFSKHLPKLQIAWDATSLKSLMTCPRQYQYGIIEGWRPNGESVDLEFGRFFASSAETYKKARINGSDKHEATLAALRYVLGASWSETGPWGGSYQQLWRCTGSEPYRNAKGNRAKCPWSHTGVWLPDPDPTTCGHCGSPTEHKRTWVPDSKVKNRSTLVSLVIGYCDAQAETRDDGAVPYAFPDGTPAVELSFRMPLPWIAGDGVSTYLLVGHLDSIMEFGNERFISDNKTTKKPLNRLYYSQYSPNIQMDTYDLAGATLFREANIRGILIEGAQTLAAGNKYGIGVVYGSDPRREEYLHDLRYWLNQAEHYAREDYWPMNRASCYLCPFKGVCSKDPRERAAYLERDFHKAPWNPLEER